MAVQVARYQYKGEISWGVHVNGEIKPLSLSCTTTGDFFQQGGAQLAQATNPNADTIALSAVKLLSPVTQDADYICQGMNYASHLKEIHRKLSDAQHNVIFHKAASSICSANDDVVRPAHVRCLDYEIELGLIIGTAITGPINVNADNLHEFIGGLVITNDISARDVQVASEQFCKGKSYRTFGPTGPFLVLLNETEIKRWGELMLQLKVNGQVRQLAPAADMIFKPVETLRELSEVRDLRPGDMIATGTPGGVALAVPSKIAGLIANFLSPATKARLLVKNQGDGPRYLKAGDVVESTITTKDGLIDLGIQTNKVVNG